MEYNLANESNYAKETVQKHRENYRQRENRKKWKHNDALKKKGLELPSTSQSQSRPSISMTQEEVEIADWLESKKQAPTSLSDGPIGKPNPNAFFTHPYICDICKAMFETEAVCLTHIENDH